VLVPEYDGWALIVLVVSAITDYADGKLARLLDQYSRLGELLDPAADRLYILAALVAFVIRGFIPWWVAALIIGRDVLLAATLPVLRRYGYTALPIHDVTTDPGNPPQFVALAKINPANSRVFEGSRKIPYKGEQVTVAYALHEEYPLLTKPHVGLLISPQKAFWRSHSAVQKLGWTIVDFSEKDLRIEAIDKSLWFGRISDIVIRVRPAGSIGVRVDLRAESRDGEFDHGRNAARIKAFFREFKF